MSGENETGILEILKSDPEITANDKALATFMKEEEADSFIKKLDIKQLVKNNEINVFHNLMKHKEHTSVKNYILEQHHDRSYTPLHCACYYGQFEIAKLLIENGANVQALNFQEDTPLHQLCYRENENKHIINEKKIEKIISLLLENKIDVNKQNKYGWTPLALACAATPSVAAQLIDANADINMENSSLSTALHMACLGGYGDLVEMLLEKGADINKKNISGSTPLHFAVEGDHLKIVAKLVDSGAKTNIKNNNNKRPLDVAYGSDKYDVLKYLAKKTDWTQTEDMYFNQEEMVKIHDKKTQTLNEKGICNALCHMYAIYNEEEKNKPKKNSFVKKLMLANVKGKYSLSDYYEEPKIPSKIYVFFDNFNALHYSVYDKNDALKSGTVKPSEDFFKSSSIEELNNDEGIQYIKKLIQDDGVLLERESSIFIRAGIYQRIFNRQIIKEEKYAVKEDLLLVNEPINVMDPKPSSIFRKNVKTAITESGSNDVIGFSFGGAGGEHITAIKKMISEGLTKYQFFDPNTGETKPMDFDQLVKCLYDRMQKTIHPSSNVYKYSENFKIVTESVDKGNMNKNKFYFELIDNKKIRYYLMNEGNEIVSNVIHSDALNIKEFPKKKENLRNIIFRKMYFILEIATKNNDFNKLNAYYYYSMYNLSKKVNDLNMVKDNYSLNLIGGKEKKYFVISDERDIAILMSSLQNNEKKSLIEYYKKSGHSDIIDCYKIIQEKIRPIDSLYQEKFSKLYHSDCMNKLHFILTDNKDISVNDRILEIRKINYKQEKIDIIKKFFKSITGALNEAIDAKEFETFLSKELNSNKQLCNTMLHNHILSIAPDIQLQVCERFITEKIKNTSFPSFLFSKKKSPLEDNSILLLNITCARDELISKLKKKNMSLPIPADIHLISETIKTLNECSRFLMGFIKKSELEYIVNVNDELKQQQTVNIAKSISNTKNIFTKIFAMFKEEQHEKENTMSLSQRHATKTDRIKSLQDLLYLNNMIEKSYDGRSQIKAEKPQSCLQDIGLENKNEWENKIDNKTEVTDRYKKELSKIQTDSSQSDELTNKHKK